MTRKKPLTLGQIKAQNEAQKEEDNAKQPAKPEKKQRVVKVDATEALFLAESSVAGRTEGDVSVPIIGGPVEPYVAPMFDYDAATADPLAELASRELCRRRLLPFIQRFRPKYVAGWVHADICRRIERFVQQVKEGKEPRLLLMMPPRSGKSEISSRHTPAWILGQEPSWEIIAASHTSSLTLSFSRYLRDLIRDPAYSAVFPDAVLDSSSQAVENWNLTKGGGYLAAGVGTGITGRGAHVLLLDDLVKDMEAADSSTIRDNTWEWYLSTAYTRLAPGGGVLGLMCMTGDTLVLMADGTQRRLDTLKRSDAIATYKNGSLGTSRVAAWRSQGWDDILKITTASGKVVRANGRHPFLVSEEGVLQWRRARSLTVSHVVIALRTYEAHGLPTSEQNTTSRLKTMLAGTRVRVGRALAVALNRALTLLTGVMGWSSTTVMLQGESGGCFATSAMPESDVLQLNEMHSQRLNTSDFILDPIIRVEADGREEVFDVQVDDTENFIACGVVSKNTWWNADDWAGRIQEAMANADGDNFEIIRYPAINESGDEYILLDDTITEIPTGAPVPPGARMTRPLGTAIHPARYTTEAMRRIKKNLMAGGQKRVWDALYQQNPVPDEGNFFSKEMFRPYSTAPTRSEMRVYQAWDFAISEGKTADYTVGVTIGVDHRDAIYVLDVRRFRSGDAFVLIDTILDYAGEYDADWLGFEDGQIWKALEAQFTKRCEEKRIYPSYEVLKPLTDKMVRANPLKGRMQAGKVFFDLSGHYFRDLQKEMLHFPAGKHDDQIDALAWAVRLTLTQSPPKDLRPQPKMKSWKDELSQYMEDTGTTHMSA